MTRIGLWLALLPVLVFGCNLSGESTPPPSEDKNPKIDACSLATHEEVAAIQGAKMLDPKSSEGPEIDFLLSQCYYGSAEPDKSVSLGLMQRNPKDPGTRTITQFWHETLNHRRAQKMAKAPRKTGRRTRARKTRNTKACAHKKSKGLAKNHIG